jgi:hypothetical protein
MDVRTTNLPALHLPSASDYLPYETFSRAHLFRFTTIFRMTLRDFAVPRFQSLALCPIDFSEEDSFVDHLCRDYDGLSTK